MQGKLRASMPLAFQVHVADNIAYSRMISGFFANIRHATVFVTGHDLTVRGETQWGMGFVTGHGFSRAAIAAKM
jgi:hypothetical protein